MTQHFESGKNMVMTADGNIHLLSEKCKMEFESEYADGGGGIYKTENECFYLSGNVGIPSKILYTTDPSLKGVKQLPREMFVREVDLEELAQAHVDEYMDEAVKKHIGVTEDEITDAKFDFKAGYNAKKGEFTEADVELAIRFGAELIHFHPEYTKEELDKKIKWFIESLRPLSLPQSLTIENDNIKINW